MRDFYRGYKGALRYIADLADDYDGFRKPESLMELIDEIRKEALTALKLGDDYNKGSGK